MQHGIPTQISLADQVPNKREEIAAAFCIRETITAGAASAAGVAGVLSSAARIH